MASFRSPPVLLGIVVFFLLIRRTYAFGAGNIASISKVEGQNWRHGDIEDTLLQLIMARAVGGKKFDKLSVSRVYFGNWLRDYSQAIDVGALKAASAEAIRLLLSVLGFLTFGYGSREFEITADRLGTYRPEDHIDNPKNYADNIDARDYDRRLRGPVDESVELAVDPETGMKNYIANENVGIMTSALHVRKLFGRSIELGRSYGNSNNKSELYEALRLLGTGLHCLEDFLAHSNYTELALIELGERDVFPHVGRGTQIRIEGARNEVYPLVTGTFGGVDFLHSVTGEVSDKLTQNEIQELEGTLKNSQNSDTSILRDLLDKIPDGLFSSGDKKQELDNIQSNAAAAQMQQVSVSPRDPEEFTLYVQNIFAQVKPVIEFHDDILQAITETIENIPILPKIVEQLEDQLSVFVFSVIAPFVVPLIDQIKNELQTGASEIIQSSKNEQYVVFENDDSSDPTHSMLSKDHFSNILNEVAGRTASKVVGWVVPQLMEAWDDDSVDIDRTLNRIIYGVLHHPAQREIGNDGVTDGRAILFRSVKEWWQDLSDEQRDEYRQKLSRQGVQNGENHKAGVHDTGHGCGHPIGMHKNYGGGNETAEDKIASAAAGAIIGGVTSGFSSIIEQNTGYQVPHQESSSSGGLGGLLSSLGGNSGGGDSGGLLGAATSFLSSGRDESGSRRETEGGYSGQSGGYEGGNRYGQEQSGRNEYSGGEERPQRRRDDDNSGGGYGGSSGGYGSSGGGYGREEPSYGGGGYGGRDDGGGGGGFRREEPPFGGGGGGGFGREEPPFGGRGGGGGYGRDEAPSGWGGGREDRREDRRGEESGWGGDRHHDGRHHDGRRRDDNRPNWGGDRQEERRYGEDEDDRHRRERRNEGGGWGN